MSTIDRIAIRRVAVERATVVSEQSFDAVLAKLAAAVVYRVFDLSMCCGICGWPRGVGKEGIGYAFQACPIDHSDISPL